MSEQRQHGAGITRRDFAKASAAAGFAVLGAKRAIAETNGGTLKAGVVGCGGRGGGAAINWLQADPNVKLTAMADVFEDRLLQRRQDILGHRDEDLVARIDVDDDHCFSGLDAYRQILETDVDVIIHATPPYIRPQQIEAAVAAGKHIFTEKPVAVDVPGCKRFRAAADSAREQGLSFVTGLQRRYQKSYRDTIARLHDGEVGEILAGRAYWCGTLPFVHEREEGWSDLEYRLRNWYNYLWVCGDNIVEQHIHNLDILNWVLGELPDNVIASGGRAWKPREEKYGDMWDSFSCDFEYPSGVHVTSMSRHWNRSANAVFEEVVGTEGKSNCRNLARDDRDPYVQEHMDLIASIRGDGPYVNDGGQATDATLTAIMGRNAAYTGKRLTWDELLADETELVPDGLDFDKAYPVGDLPIPGAE